MNTTELEALLTKRQVQPTAIRLLVLKALSEAGRSLSLLDLETILDTVDKLCGHCRVAQEGFCDFF